MAALTNGRDTIEIAGGDTLILPVKGGVTIFEGSLVALNADGLAIPAAKATGLTAAGRAEQYVNNSSGADKAQSVKVRRGVFKWDNDEAAPVTDAGLLKSCYIVDDHTVTTTATGASIAGKVLGFSDGEVIVETR